MNYNLELYKNFNNRKRMSPADRKEHLLIAYIGMVVGDIMIGSSNPPCYLTVGHSDIADATRVCVATVFNYFNTVEDLHCEIEEWAITHTAEKDQDTREAAKAILAQWAAIFPLNANASGIEVKTAPATKVA